MWVANGVAAAATKPHTNNSYSLLMALRAMMRRAGAPMRDPAALLAHDATKASAQFDAYRIDGADRLEGVTNRRNRIENASASANTSGMETCG